MSDGKSIESLHPRARNCLNEIMRSTKLSEDELRHCIAAGMLKPIKWRNIGVKMQQQILEWSNVPMRCPTCKQIWPVKKPASATAQK